jgi:uncharacterized SAM-binding protein YcdF (DUF218 family)
LVRGPRWLLVALPVVAAGLLGVYGRWVAGAPSAESPAGDAVVVHAGGQGERLRHGLALMDRGAAPTLVVMFGSTTPGARRSCGQTEPYEVLCPVPDPATTIGEAGVLRDLAGERGWTSVVAVTSDYHLRRAVHLDASCSGIDVIGSAAEPDLGLADRLARVAKEMIALPVAALSSC